MAKRIRNFMEFELLDSDMEHPKGLSQTVPDETMSIREIVTRYTRGQNMAPGSYREPQYNDNATFDSEDIEKLKNADIVDQREYIDVLQRELDEKRAAIEKQKERLFLHQQKVEKAAKESRQRDDEGGQEASTSRARESERFRHGAEAQREATRRRSDLNPRSDEGYTPL